jgi:hypothetical protein
LLFLLIDLPIVLLESWFASRCQLSHAFRVYYSTVIPIDRAVPAMILAA